MKNDPFEEVLPLCKKTNVLIQEVFNNPEIVMGKLVQNIYTSKLQVRTWVKIQDESQGLPWLRICCSQHFSQMEKVGAKWIDLSQGFSKKVMSRSCFVFNSLPTRGDFCHLLITFANSLDPDQARQNVGPDLYPYCLTPWWYF